MKTCRSLPRTPRTGRCRPATTPTRATRKLDQINKDNVGDLQVAWTFSTGVLRGHEGGPLVIGDVMYVHTPFPNIVYALDLNDDGRIIWKYEPQAGPERHRRSCAATRSTAASPMATARSSCTRPTPRVAALDAKTGEVAWQVKNGDPGQGRDQHRGAAGLSRTRSIVGISGGEFGVRGSSDRLQPRATASWPGAATRSGPDDETLIDPEKTTHLGKPVGKDSGTAPGKATSGRSAAAPPGAGTRVRSRAQPGLLRHRQSRRPGTRCSAPATIAGR